jgi:hypothetical protein
LGLGYYNYSQPLSIVQPFTKFELVQIVGGGSETQGSHTIVLDSNGDAYSFGW